MFNKKDSIAIIVTAVLVLIGFALLIYYHVIGVD
jgi:membrane protein involved in colicin uptake